MDENKQLSIRDEITNLAPQFKAALPPHIPVERFTRIVLTAVASDPDLARADRRSLLEASLRCAQDGLLPDKREAAFVVFNSNVAKNGEQATWVKKVVYIPMVAGLLKKIRNSGELASIAAHIVFENDQFDYQLGDGEQINHKPLLKGPRGAPILAYAIARTKDGGTYREVMPREEIEAVRNFSKAKDSGPWSSPFYLEMWKKTVLRRLAKRLPMSTDLERDYFRDEDEEPADVTPPDQENAAAVRLRKSLLEYCQRNNGGSPNAILRELTGCDDFSELTEYQADRAHRDFEEIYLGAERRME
jgi:recombination protein RecT